jgi:hypothetical protein
MKTVTIETLKITTRLPRGRWPLSLKTILVFAALMVFFEPVVQAQWQSFPLPKAKSSVKKHRSNPAARPQAVEPLSLPFFDDFSFTTLDDPKDTTSNIALDSLWQNVINDTLSNKTVWINNGMGINPPSINVATFDGLDGNHVKYSEVVINNGLRDSLVSQPIKLGDPSVAVADRNSVYLSFFFQWAGNGEPPDATDYLLVEFKNNAGVWKPSMTIYPTPSMQTTVFYDTLVKVDGDEFFHDDFQFRFRNYGRLSGPYDTWNVDYVYLNKGRNESDTSFPDRTIASQPTSLLGNYRAIPYDHFKLVNTLQAPKFDVYNLLEYYPSDHAPGFTTVSFRTEKTFTNYVDSVANITTTPADTAAINWENNNDVIGPLERRTITVRYLPDGSDPAQFDPDADSARVKLNIRLLTGDTFNKNGDYADDYSANFIPIDFRLNDTLTVQYFMKDYYAYDDGVAEYAAGLTQAGNRAAFEYEMVTDDPDTLVGIDLYVPDYGLASNLTVDFFVYRDADGLPGDILYTLPSISIQRKGLNVFQRVRIVEPFLVDKNFHIGWKAPVGGTLKIGLDMSSSHGDKISVNTNGTWVPGDIDGSLMIRPVFGNGDVNVGVPETLDAFGVYPNPNSGEFYIHGRYDKLTVLTITGQAVPYAAQPSGDRQKIVLNTAAGLYILKIQQGNTVATRKIVVR